MASTLPDTAVQREEITPPTSPASRLMSLDLFRGATIAGMILVNNAGDESSSYWPLKHAEWNGWTPTDLVFPFFLFIVGVALAFSFSSRLKRGESRSALLRHVLWRGLALFALGMWAVWWATGF
jgi:predicted acyltransferase